MENELPELSVGEELLNTPNIQLVELYPKLHRIKFNEPTILRVRKFATKLVPAYKGSLWGSKRYIRKWGVEIYDPSKDKGNIILYSGRVGSESCHATFREHDNKLDRVFEFIITEDKLFKNKSEMKKFLLTMFASPFVKNHLNFYDNKRNSKRCP